MKTLILIALFVVVAHAMPSPNIKSYVRIEKPETITLSHVVNWPGAKKEIKTRLSKVILGDGPQLGEQRVFTGQAIARLVRKNLPELSGVKIPSRVTIENRGFQLTKQDVQTKLNLRWKKLCRECEFIFRSVSLPILPARAIGKAWRLEDQGRLPRGSFSRRLEVFQDSGAPVVYWVSGRVEIHKKVPVSKRSVEIGYRLKREDFKESLRDVTFATDGIPSLKEIIGQKVRRAMNANDVIWAGFIEREKALNRGDLVKVVAQQPGWQVSLRAVAEQDGFVGDRVRLRNIKSKQLLTGLVIARG